MSDGKEKGKGVLNAIERIGNQMPHPNYIFLILFAVVIIISGLCDGIKFLHPGTGKEQAIKSLLGVDGLNWFLSNIVTNFINFRPLGLVLVTSMGIGLAEESGFLRTALQSSVVNAPPMLITTIVVFAGLMGNLAGSAIFVIVPPLGALIFKAVGRHPIAGLAAGFGGVAAGLSANLLISPTDILLSGITESAARIMDPDFTVNPAANWYFMVVSTVVLTIIGTVVNEKIVEPKLGKYDLSMADENTQDDMNLMNVTAGQKKGMRYAGIAVAVYVVIVSLTIVPENGILRGPGGTVVPSPFLDYIASIFTFLFATLGIAYGIGAGTIKKANDIINFLAKSMAGLAGFIVLCFFASQFVEAFSYTNLGLLLSVNGANFLEASGFKGIPLIICFLVVNCVMDIFIGSSSAKWALISPIFVPMFMRISLTPFFTQAAYRISDSVINAVSPLEPFMPFIITQAQKYDKKAGLGTVISTMLPIAVGYFIPWSILLIIWYVLDLPLGPGAGIFM